MTGKPTEGKWVLKEWGEATKVQAVERTPGLPIVTEVAIFIGRQQKENAMLAQEAGTAYHETGLTPRQLAEQRDELLGTVKCFRDWLSWHEAKETLQEVDDIIAKVEAKP